jgi:hypothetical protein
MSRLPPPAPGPIETNTFAEKLTARVVAPGPRPRLHGYDVQGDLALHYGFVEVAWLAVTGELPQSAAVVRAFEVCLAFLAPASIAEPPSHVASLTRMCGGTDAGVLATGAVALAEQAQDLTRRHAPLHEWLGAPEGKLPEGFRACSEADRAAVARLAQALDRTGFPVVALREDLSLEAAIVCALHACGLRAAHQLETAVVLARLPAVAAEGFAARFEHLRSYPIDLPHFAYEAPDDG